jgi:hypothetical protein
MSVSVQKLKMKDQTHTCYVFSLFDWILHIKLEFNKIYTPPFQTAYVHLNLANVH